MDNKLIDQMKEKFINEAVEEAQAHSMGLLSKEAIAQKVKLQAAEELNLFFEKVKRGCAHLLSIVYSTEREENRFFLATAVHQIENNLLEISQYDQERQASRIVEETSRYWGTSDSFRLQLYQIAKSTLQAKEFERGGEIFLVLTLLFPQTAEFWLGIGIAEQEQGHFQEASSLYVQALELDPQLIYAYIYAAECYSALGYRNQASAILNLLFENNSKDQIDTSLWPRIEYLKNVY